MELEQNSLFDESDKSNQLELDFSHPVGEPMVEIGRLGLIEFCDKDKFNSYEEFEKEMKKLFNTYVFSPSKTLNQIFSDNSKFTHNSTAKDLKQRFENSFNYFHESITQNYKGFCLSCGKKDDLCNVEKMLFPMTTGDKNVNFTSFFSSNLLMCKTCMSSLFFIPINSQKVDWGKAFLISDNSEINKFWAEINNELLTSNIVKNIDIMPDSKTSIFTNFIYEMLEELKDEELFGDITFYLISNVDRNTQIDFIHINRNQLEFIKSISPKSFTEYFGSSAKNEWNSLIFKYANKERKLDGKKVKFADDVIANKNYKNGLKYFNPLINSFINNKSILGFLKRSHSSWHLTQIYLKEIKGMRKERLEVLKKVADNLQNFNKNDDKQFINKVIFPIEKTKSQSEFREKLRSLMRKYLLISKEPLFGTDEMVFQILPSGENWQETRDILLIALYEKLTLDDELKEEIEKNIDGGDNDE